MSLSRATTEQAIIKEPEITDGVMLAATLRHEGRYDDARAVLADELASLDPEDAAGRLAVACETARVEMCDGRAPLAVCLLLRASSLAELSESHEQTAKFHHTLAAAYQLAGETDKAILEYVAAAFHWDEAGCPFDAGCTENNVGLLCGESGDFAEAHKHFARARSYFSDETVKAAEVDETEAQILLAEGKPHEALRLVTGAVSVFCEYGETDLRDKALRVLIKAATDCQAEGTR